MTEAQRLALAEALEQLALQLRGEARGTPLAYDEILEGLGRAYDELEEAVEGHA